MRQSHIAIIGAPVDLGQDRRGVDMGPSALRVANLNRRIASLGYAVDDLGNVHADQAESSPEGNEHAKYLDQIATACGKLATMVGQALSRGSFPVVLGGDWNTTTYNASSAFNAILGFWLRVFMGVENTISNHYLHPDRHFEKELFKLVEARGGKLFAGLYALYSGMVFLVVAAIALAPVVHRVLHRFHLEDNGPSGRAEE